MLFLQGDVLELPIAETVLIADLERPLSGAAIEESAAGGTGRASAKSFMR